MSRPWLKWWPRDWRADPRLRMCSLAARGLWIEFLGYMHEAEPYGHLLIDGRAPNLEGIAALVGRPVKEVRKAFDELEAQGVFSRQDDVVYSRRMVRDNTRTLEGKENADKRWANSPPNRDPNGSPNAPPNGSGNGEANRTPNAHIPEERKKDAAAPPSNPEKELFDRGKQVLGEKAGGLIKNLLKAKSGDLALARAAIETASTKGNPREYVSGIVNAKPREGEFVWKSGIPGVL